MKTVDRGPKPGTSLARAARAHPLAAVALVTMALVLLVACGNGGASPTVPEPGDSARLLVTDDGAELGVRELDGQTLNGTVALSAEVDGSVSEVHFVIDGLPQPPIVDDTPPFLIQFDTTKLADGEHTMLVMTPGIEGEAPVVLAQAQFTVVNASDEPPLLDDVPGDGGTPPVEEPDPVEPPVEEPGAPGESHATRVSISGDRWLVNGAVTNPRSQAEGLLMNARMVQATFEDANRSTVANWSYPDGTPFDAERQTSEFIAMVPVYAEHGLNAVTISLQGGRPMPGSQVWVNSAFEPSGRLRPSYMARVARVIEALDAHGMVAIVSYFYFGQDQNFEGEAAIRRATREATSWLVTQGYTNVIVELVNEAGHHHYDHSVFGADRVHELVRLARDHSSGRLLLSASLGGGYIPPARLMEASDYHMLHGNNQNAARVAEMVDEVRSRHAYGGEPIVFNEDSTDLSNMRAAVAKGASWGYYDQGENDYRSGYQSPPTNWGINTSEKRAFFDLVREMTRPR